MWVSECVEVWVDVGELYSVGVEFGVFLCRSTFGIVRGFPVWVDTVWADTVRVDQVWL